MEPLASAGAWAGDGCSLKHPHAGSNAATLQLAPISWMGRFMSFCNAKDVYFQSSLDRIGANYWIGVTAGDKCFESTCFNFSHFSRKIMVASSTRPAGGGRVGSLWCRPVLQGLMESHPALLVSAGQHSGWSQIGNVRLGIAVRLLTTAVCFMASNKAFWFFLQLGSP